MFKPISGFEKYFGISKDGQVISFITSNIRKPSLNKDGYLRVTLYKKGSNLKTFKHFFIHTLVALTYIGPCPVGYEVNHKDGNKLNNHINNLEYLSKTDNRYHMYNTCGRIGARKRYSKEQKIEIVSLYSTIKSQQKVADTLNIPRSTVKSILDNFKHIR